jgi:glucosamine-phosphate N-acetyltransferase
MSSKILVTLLTSPCQYIYFNASINSLLNQQQIDWEQYTFLIVVNSVNINYFNKIEILVSNQIESHTCTKTNSKPNLHLVQTKSNGKPGKGHNSVLHLVKTFTDPRDNRMHDYAVMIDGDDFLYPFALSRIHKYRSNTQFEALLLPYSDTLSYKYHDTTLSVPLTDGAYLRYNNFITPEKMFKQWIIQTHLFSLDSTKTGARILSIDCAFVKSDDELKYNETSWLDDLNPFLHLCGKSQTGKRIFFLTDCDLFLYNRLTKNPSSSKLPSILNHKHGCGSDHNIKYECIRKSFLSSLPSNKEFTVSDKVNYCNKLIDNYNISHFPPMRETNKSNIQSFLNYAILIDNTEMIKVYKQVVRNEYNIRPLERCDHAKGYGSLLAQLTSADFTQEQFEERFDQLEKLKAIQPTFIFVAEHVPTQTIVASAACAVELKFIHSNGSVGHVEDVVTDSEHRRKGLAKQILQELQNAAIGFGCYKVILDCAEHNVPVYAKVGFVQKEIQMVKYFE